MYYSFNEFLPRSFVFRNMVASFPPFALGENQFDRTTYNGRFWHFVNVINPLTLSKSDTDIRNAEALLSRSKSEADGGIVNGFTNSGTGTEFGFKSRIF